MKKLKIITTAILFFYLISIVNIQLVKADGYGVGPNYINIDSALRNMTYSQTIIIYNENDFDAQVNFNKDGEARDWINIFDFNAECCPIKSKIISKNSNTGVLCKIEIPKDAANKLHNSFIYLDFNATSPKPIEGNFSNVSLSLAIEVALNVTGDQDYNVTIKSLDINDVEVNDILKIITQFENNGNVNSKPTIEITITKDNVYIDKIISSTTINKPSSINTRTIEWNTTGKAAGRYNAYINIYEGNNKLRQTNYSFQLLPIGTLVRDGIFKGLTYEGELEKGKIIRLIASFINNGQIEIEAQFFGEIYKDNDLVGTITSPVVNVPKYKEHNFLSYFTLNENGEYTIKGYVLYGGKPTDTKQLKLSVGAISINNLILLLIILLIIFTFVYIYYFSKKKKIVLWNKIKLPKRRVKSAKQTKKLRIQVKKKEDKKRVKRKIKIRRNKPNIIKREIKPKTIKKEKETIKKKAERKIKVKNSKPTSINIDEMSAKEIEEYVQNL